MNGLQTFGNYFGDELGKTPGGADGAYNRALERVAASGVFSGAAWAAFPVRAFQGPVKQMMFQAFGVQPGVGMAHRAVDNALTDKPLTEGLGDAYTQGALGTLPIAGGHHLGMKAGEKLAIGLDKKPPSQGAEGGNIETKHAENANAGQTRSTERDTIAEHAGRAITPADAIREARERYGTTPAYEGRLPSADGRTIGEGSGGLGGISETVYHARSEIAEIWKRGGISAPEFFELKPGNGEIFHGAISSAKHASDQAAAVTLYSVADYDNMRFF